MIYRITTGLSYPFLISSTIVLLVINVGVFCALYLVYMFQGIFSAVVSIVSFGITSVAIVLPVELKRQRMLHEEVTLLNQRANEEKIDRIIVMLNAYSEGVISQMMGYGWTPESHIPGVSVVFTKCKTELIL